MFNMNFFIALVALIVLVYILVKANYDERGGMIAVGWCAFLLGSHLVIGIVKAITEGERDYSKEAKALIESCEADLPRNQNCVIEMKAVVK